MKLDWLSLVIGFLNGAAAAIIVIWLCSVLDKVHT